MHNSGVMTGAWAGLVAFVLVLLSPASAAIAQDAPGAPEPDQKQAQAAARPEDQRWNLHGQTTVVWQGYGRIRSLYQGDNSLPAGGQGRETVSATAALGVRLLPGTELYFNPEVFQGFGLAQTHGLGGFSNGEAQKGGNLYPKAYVARAFLRQTFGFGGGQEKIEDEFNQLGGMKDVQRVTVTAGKFAVNDIFDRNSVSQDARVGFLNYANWAGGGFDYGADQKGYGAGLVVDFNQKHWAFRTGYFLLPVHSNAQTLSWSVDRQGQAIAELELRYGTGSKMPGTLRLLGWQSRANAGSYAEALQDANFDPEESIIATRRIRTQTGFGVNVEQKLTESMSAFARYSWRDAKSEITSWADMDRSTSVGVVVTGVAWGRPKDRIGLAGAYNELSKSHADFTAAGGLGVTIGDGQLKYAGEKILESYYSLSLGGQSPNALTFNYQYITDPAYNADRGPVSLFSLRLHGEF